MNLSGWFLKNESKFCIESMQKLFLLTISTLLKWAVILLERQKDLLC